MAERKDPIQAFACPEAWDTWLAEHHAEVPGVWLKMAKAGSGIPSVTYAQALEVALRWGWIDSQKDAGDAVWWLQRFTPRGPRSRWSQVNRDKAERLIEAGAMQPPGLAEVARAKADGRWEAAYSGSKSAVVPEDLLVALAANPAAEAFFATLNSANRYSILYRIHEAKRPETRARRIGQFVAMLGRGETLIPGKPKPGDPPP